MIELLLVFALGLLGLGVAAYLARWLVGRPIGDVEMARAAALVRSVADAFERRQAGTIGALSAALGGAIFLAYGLLRRGHGEAVTALELGVWLTVSFALGAGSAVTVAHVATWIATRASVRTASAARRSLDSALQVAIRSGAVSGLFACTIGLLGLALLVVGAFAYKGGFGPEPAPALALLPSIPMLVAGHALGASFVALLGQLGGGTFAKAADLAADTAGKEAGLVEDDARNPATIADLAGDAVGDCAGRAVALFQSGAAENLGAMIVAGELFRDNKDLPSAFAVILFPLVARAFGVVGAIFGVMVVRTDDREDPMSPLARGMYVAALLHALGLAGAAKWLLGPHWLAFFGCGAIGVAVSLGLLHATQYFTEHRHRPVRELADAARGGPTLAILSGVATGLESAFAPLAIVVFGTFGAYHLGAATHLEHGGLFGTAVATMGLLGTAGYVLAMDAFGSIVDASGGIVEMTVARERPDVRGRTVVLDSVGNTAKAFTKAYAAGSAMLASLLLVAGYLDEAHRRVAAIGKVPVPLAIRLDSPEVIVAALAGILLVLWFAARCIGNVTRAARRLVDEARRQLRDRPEDVAPDHVACADLASRSSLRQMIAPAVVVTAAPVAIGVCLRLARTEDNPLIAADSVAALVVAGTIAGVMGSLLLGNVGGAWDNAKKYIITGAHGGRYLVDETGARADNPTYSAAALGDAVGDPLKDTAGPAIHVLVKLLSVLTIVFLPFFL